MTRTRGARRVEYFIYAATALAFLDETVRKVLPETPILVTAVKDALLFLAGLHIVALARYVPGRYAKYFVPWMAVTFVSALWVFLRYGSLLALAATVRTYCLAPLLFAVGYYLGCNDEARRGVWRVFLIGGIAAMVVACAQEFARDSLPSFLSARIYKARHSGAGGSYNESLFASPQTLALVAVTLATWAFSAIALPSTARRRIGAIGVLAAGIVTAYLSRIRTAPFIAVFALSLTYLGAWKVRGSVREMPAAMRGLLLGLAVLALIGTSYFLVTLEFPNSPSDQAAQDATFYRSALRWDELRIRMRVFIREIAQLENHDPVFGYGAGTGGQVKRFVDTGFDDIPVVSDTGIFLLYHEMGIIGLFAFILCYVGLIARCGWQMATRRSIPGVSVPAFAIGVGLLIWFLFKSHACIANGLSHALWMGSIGLCCSALDRQRREEGARAEARRSPVPSTAEDDASSPRGPQHP